MTAAGSFMQVPAVHTGLQYQVSGLQPKVHNAMQSMHSKTRQCFELAKHMTSGGSAQTKTWLT